MMCYSYNVFPYRVNAAAMPDSLRKFIGLLLLFATVGVASCQALLVSCSSSAANMTPTLSR